MWRRRRKCIFSYFKIFISIQVQTSLNRGAVSCIRLEAKSFNFSLEAFEGIIFANAKFADKEKATPCLGRMFSDYREKKNFAFNDLSWVHMRLALTFPMRTTAAKQKRGSLCGHLPSSRTTLSFFLVILFSAHTNK